MTFPAAGLRDPLIGWQRVAVADVLRAGALGVSADTNVWRRQAGGRRFLKFLAKRGLVILTVDRRIIVADRRGLSELLAAGDDG